MLSLDELDRLLDLPVAGFEAAVERLVRRLARQQVTIDVPPASRAAKPVNLAVSLPGQREYQRELHRLVPMDRAEEFRMARRYEFLRARTQAGLRSAGVTRLALEGWTRRPIVEVWEALSKSRRPARRPLGEQCLREFHALRNRYVEGNLYLVLGTVFRYSGLGVDAADLIQEGNASLFQAIERFDWRRDVRFKTYAQYWVHQAVLKLLYNTSRTVRIPVWVQKALRKIRRYQDDAVRDGQMPDSDRIGGLMGIPAKKVEELLAVRRSAVSLDARPRGDEDGTSLAQMLADEDQLPVYEQVREGDLAEALEGVMGELPDRERTILKRRYGLGGVEPETLGEIADDLGITAERVRQLQNAALGRLKRPTALGRLKMFG